MTVSRAGCSRVMTQMDRDDERVLVARLSAGDTDAFDELYAAYRPKVFAFLLRMSRSRAVAEDLLDETWLRLVKHARDLRPDLRPLHLGQDRDPQAEGAGQEGLGHRLHPPALPQGPDGPGRAAARPARQRLGRRLILLTG